MNDRSYNVPEAKGRVSSHNNSVPAIAWTAPSCCRIRSPGSP
jgi:hypothetical protein